MPQTRFLPQRNSKQNPGNSFRSLLKDVIVAKAPPYRRWLAFARIRIRHPRLPPSVIISFSRPTPTLRLQRLVTTKSNCDCNCDCAPSTIQECACSHAPGPEIDTTGKANHDHITMSSSVSPPKPWERAGAASMLLQSHAFYGTLQLTRY